MASFTTLESQAIVLPIADIDTDQIIPARFLKVTDKVGLGEKLFCDWRYFEDGTPNPEFVINRPELQGRKILVAGDNFGCGSSREHAPWALVDWGFRAVLSTSFADIFKGNSLKNGLLPVEIDKATYVTLLQDPEAVLQIDLESQTVVLPEGKTVHFDVDPFSKKCLLEGIDQLGYLQGFADQIRQYEERTNRS